MYCCYWVKGGITSSSSFSLFLSLSCRHTLSTSSRTRLSSQRRPDRKRTVPGTTTDQTLPVLTCRGFISILLVFLLFLPLLQHREDIIVLLGVGGGRGEGGGREGEPEKELGILSVVMIDCQRKWETDNFARERDLNCHFLVSFFFLSVFIFSLFFLIFFICIFVLFHICFPSVCFWNWLWRDYFFHFNLQQRREELRISTSHVAALLGVKKRGIEKLQINYNEREKTMVKEFYVCI